MAKKVVIVPGDKSMPLQSVRGKVAIYQYDPAVGELEVYPSDAQLLISTGKWFASRGEPDQPSPSPRLKGDKRHKALELADLSEPDFLSEVDED